MPATTVPRWVSNLRGAVATKAADGWAVAENRGRVQLSIRIGQRRQKVTLPIAWEAGSAADAIYLIGQLHQATATGDISLRDALHRLTEPTSTAVPVEARGQWRSMVQAFRSDLMEHGNQVKACT